MSHPLNLQLEQLSRHQLQPLNDEGFSLTPVQGFNLVIYAPQEQTETAIFCKVKAIDNPAPKQLQNLLRLNLPGIDLGCYTTALSVKNEVLLITKVKTSSLNAQLLDELIDDALDCAQKLRNYLDEAATDSVPAKHEVKSETADELKTMLQQPSALLWG